MSEATTHSFKAEVSQVLHLVVNSLYSHKEVFLRELVSNASDALDKRRFEAVTHAELASDSELKIQISASPGASTLTISDNGIGMNATELEQNLGTIARSGTREFLNKIQKAREASDQGLQLIGQFGVGFYSAYLVADRVDVITRRAGEERVLDVADDEADRPRRPRDERARHRVRAVPDRRRGDPHTSPRRVADVAVARKRPGSGRLRDAGLSRNVADCSWHRRMVALSAPP